MFESLRSKTKPQPDKKSAEARMRATQGSSSAELAASLLIAPTALMQLTLEEARTIVSFMAPRKISIGTTFITEGDTSASEAPETQRTATQDHRCLFARHSPDRRGRALNY